MLISQIVRYAGKSSGYHDVRGLHISNDLSHGYGKHRLEAFLKNVYGRHHDRVQ